MELAKEVQSILTSPYAVSLKGLHHILGITNARDLGRWASGNTCQIDALTAAVLEGLQLWPYALDILKRLATIVAFRDAVLRQNPSMLDGLLNAAITSSRESCPATAACISMLSHPLPESYGVPASFPTFLLRVMEKATEKPSVATMRPLYSLITGGGSFLLSILPLDIVTRFQEQLIKVLKNLEDQSASLLCLAIFARVSHDYPAPSSIGDVDHNSDPYYTARQFFIKKRVSKTLDLVVLRAILASSSSMAMPQAVESLQLAVEIIDVVEAPERTMWVEQNLVKLKKLVEKVSQPNVDHNVQLAALAVLASLAPMVSLPEGLVSTLEDRLQVSEFGSVTHFCWSVDQFNICWSPASYNLDSIVQAYASRFSDTFIRSQMLKLLQIALHSCNLDKFLELLSARSFAKCLTRAIKNSSRLRQEILATLRSSEIREAFEYFLNYKLEDQENIENHVHQVICPSMFERTKRLLQHDICLLILKATLCSSNSTSIDSSVSMGLLAKAEKSMDPLSKCQAFVSCQQPQMASLSLLEVKQTPTALRGGINWRDRMREELSREADQSYRTMARIVDETCRELEDRCNNAEAPLRKEQATSMELQHQLADSRSKCVELERDAREQVSIIDALEAENSSLVDQVSVIEQQIGKSTEELEEAQRELHQAKDEILTSKELALAKGKQQEFEHLAVLAAKEELMEKQASELTKALADSKTLESRMSSLQAESSKTEEKASSFEESLRERELELKEARISIERHTKDVEGLLQREAERTTMMESMKLEIQELLLEAKKTEIEWAEKVSDLKTTASHDHQNYASDIASKDAEAIKQAHFYNQSLLELQAELKESKSKSLLHSQKQERVMTDLQTKIRQLTDEREERLEELAHAQDLRTKVMAVMGVHPDQLVPNQTKLRPPKPPKWTNQTEFHIAEDMSPETPSQFQRSFGSSTSSSKSGPTPKRSKPRRSSKPSIMQQPRSGKRVHGGMDKPEEEHTKEAVANSPDNKENTSMPGTFDTGDLSSFGGSDIFASTDQQPGVSNGAYDETTAENSF